MFIKQLSVFIENREGRLKEVLKTLKEAGVNIVSLSLADTEDFGVLRLIVSKPSEGKEALKAKGFSAKLTDVIAIKIGNEVGGLNDILEKLTDENINIEYMYALMVGGGNASIVVKTKDAEKMQVALDKNHVGWLTDEDIQKIAEA